MNLIRKLALLALAIVPIGCGGGAREAGAPDAARAAPAEVFVVRAVTVRDTKSAFATVDSVDAVVARARIAGTVRELRVREGDQVRRGDRLALIADARLPLQAEAQGAEAEALQQRLAQARGDLERFERLHADGFFPTQRLETARAEVRALDGQLRAARSQRAVTVESGAQGAVLAPVDGRVLRLPVRAGSVVMTGETIALVGSSYVLKLHMPERHAPRLQAGGEVWVEGRDGARVSGRVAKVYPALADGRVEADIETDGLEGRVFGERVRVWTPADRRQALVVPARYLENRFGVDFARLRRADGSVQDVIVRRGEPIEAETLEDGVEILAGLAAGDVLLPVAATARGGA